MRMRRQKQATHLIHPPQIRPSDFPHQLPRRPPLQRPTRPIPSSFLLHIPLIPLFRLFIPYRSSSSSLDRLAPFHSSSLLCADLGLFLRGERLEQGRYELRGVGGVQREEVWRKRVVR